MNFITSAMQRNKKLIEVLSNIENKQGPVLLSGLTDVAKCAIIATIQECKNSSILLVTYNELQAKKIAKDLKYFYKNTYLFTKKDIVTYDYEVESFDSFYKRINVLNEINSNKKTIIVTTIETVAQKMIPKDILYAKKIKLKVGDTINLEELKENLVALGYERCEMIEANGEFCIRGGIIDVSLNENTGVRIELWGDDIDSIRMFSISSQRSTQMLEKIEINPLHEFLLETTKEEVINKILKRKLHSKAIAKCK